MRNSLLSSILSPGEDADPRVTCRPSGTEMFNSGLEISLFSSILTTESFTEQTGKLQRRSWYNPPTLLTTHPALVQHIPWVWAEVPGGWPNSTMSSGSSSGGHRRAGAPMVAAVSWKKGPAAFLFQGWYSSCLGDLRPCQAPPHFMTLYSWPLPRGLPLAGT